MVDRTTIAASQPRPSKIAHTIDWELQGVQHCHLRIPHSTNDSPWGSINMPVSIYQMGVGPTVLITGGNHGDEYEGPIALCRTLHKLDVDRITGSVILLPGLNFPALKTGTRLSPIDGKNMNRIFPGNSDGTVSELIADFIYRQFVSKADAVLDIHSGGRMMRFAPTSIIHALPDEQHYQRCLEAAMAFGAPYCTVLEEMDSAGMLDTAVEELGKVFVSTELGGSGTTSPQTLEIAERGIHNFLVALGALQDERIDTPQSKLVMSPENGFIVSDCEGLFDCRVSLGDFVKQGDVIAEVHHLDRPWEASKVFKAPLDGELLHRHDAGRIHNGDCLAVLGVAMDAPR